MCFKTCQKATENRPLNSDRLEEVRLPQHDPLRIMVAPTGALRSKLDHAALPITPGEIARAAADCQAVGASDLHLHVRDANGNHSLDAGLILETMAEVNALAPDLRVQLSTDSAGYFEVTAQLRVLQRVVPQAASINIREMARDEAIAARLYKFAAAAEIEVQHILYGPEDLRLLHRWMAGGIVPASQSSILCVTGRASPFLAGRPEELGRIASALRGAVGAGTGWCPVTGNMNLPLRPKRLPWVAMSGSGLKTTLDALTEPSPPTTQNRWQRWRWPDIGPVAPYSGRPWCRTANAARRGNIRLAALRQGDRNACHAAADLRKHGRGRSHGGRRQNGMRASRWPASAV